MLVLSLPALVIGIFSSLILIALMKAAAVLQNCLWVSLPARFGLDLNSPGWILLMLTLTGIAVGLVIRYMPGHAGPDPATEPLIGAPVPVTALPGLVLALNIGLAQAALAWGPSILLWR